MLRTAVHTHMASTAAAAAAATAKIAHLLSLQPHSRLVLQEGCWQQHLPTQLIRKLAAVTVTQQQQAARERLGRCCCSCCLWIWPHNLLLLLLLQGWHLERQEAELELLTGACPEPQAVALQAEGFREQGSSLRQQAE